MGQASTPLSENERGAHKRSECAGYARWTPSLTSSFPLPPYLVIPAQAGIQQTKRPSSRKACA